MLPEMSDNYHLLPPLMLACAASYFVSTLLMDGSIYTLKLKRRGVEVDTTVDPLKLVHVHEVMPLLENVVSVKPETPLSVVGFMVWESEHTAFPVISGDRYLGMVTLEEISKIKQEAHESTMASDIVLSDLPVIHPSDTVDRVVESLSESGSELLPVLDPIDHSKLVGLVSDSDSLVSIALGKKKMRILG